MSDAEIKEAARLERNAYYRAWRAKNKDKVKEIFSSKTLDKPI